jgi:hypothetical protein
LLYPINSHWRSAGLLFYYSFLNYAKAYLLANGKSEILQSDIKVQHGLSEVTHGNDVDFLDYSIHLHPPKSKTSLNVFANLYKAVFNTDWPFRNKIEIKIRDLIKYSPNISSEVENIYQIKTNFAYCQSILRESGNEIWIESICAKNHEDMIQSELSDKDFTILEGKSISDTDRSVWFQIYGLQNTTLNRSIIFKLPSHSFASGDKQSAFDESISETQKKLDKLANIFPYHNPDDYWLFFPSMKIGDQIIPWNSFISDYLISFAIGHILRYEPKLIDEDSKDSFLSKTWCSQAADEVVRQFLFRLSNPSIVL